ncbi:hypothetical protein D3C86_1075020 [compost metagenome]
MMEPLADLFLDRFTNAQLVLLELGYVHQHRVRLARLTAQQPDGAGQCKRQKGIGERLRQIQRTPGNDRLTPFALLRLQSLHIRRVYGAKYVTTLRTDAEKLLGPCVAVRSRKLHDEVLGEQVFSDLVVAGVGVYKDVGEWRRRVGDVCSSRNLAENVAN